MPTRATRIPSPVARVISSNADTPAGIGGSTRRKSAEASRYPRSTPSLSLNPASNSRCSVPFNRGIESNRPAPVTRNHSPSPSFSRESAFAPGFSKSASAPGKRPSALNSFPKGAAPENSAASSRAASR